MTCLTGCGSDQPGNRTAATATVQTVTIPGPDGDTTLTSRDCARARDSVENVRVFLTATATTEDRKSLQDEFRKIDGVQGVSHTSKEEALKRAKELFKDDPEVLDDLAGNPFPESLDVDVTSTSAVSRVVAAAKANPAVIEVADGETTNAVMDMCVLSDL